MTSILIEIALCLSLLMPMQAQAAEVLAKDPLSYPLKQWGFVLMFALLGGFASWYAKVKKGEIDGKSVQAFIGEHATAAFAGLLAFLGCEWAGISPLLTGPIAGLAGHQGTKAIAVIEGVLRTYLESKKPPPLPDPPKE